jgi:hypothetical protein
MAGVSTRHAAAQSGSSSWFSEHHGSRAASRGSVRPASIGTFIGLRPCCLLPPGPLLGSPASQPGG